MIWPLASLLLSSNGSAYAPPTEPLTLKWDLALHRTPSAHTTIPTHRPESPKETTSSWSQLLASAQQHAAANRMASAQIDAVHAQEKQAKALAWMPRIELTGSSNRQKQTYNGTQSRTPASALSLNATLPLWRAAERASAQAQEAMTTQSRWQAKTQATTVARELSMAYLAAAEAAEQTRLSEAQLALLQSLLHINERRLQAGIGTVLDHLETRTRLEEVKANVREWRMRVASQRLTVMRLSAKPAVKTAAGLSPQVTALPSHLPSLSDALMQAVQVNPQWQDAQAGIAAARATTSARDAEAWQPTLDAVASASRTRQTQQFEGLSEKQNLGTQSVGVQFNWPLFSGGYHHGRIQESAALLVRAQAHSDLIEAEVQAGLQDAYQRRGQAQSIIEAQQAVEQTAMATHAAVHKAFVAGLRTNLDLLNAQQQIYTARQNLVSARITAMSAHIDILALLDRLDPNHVAALEAQIDPQAMTESTP